MRTDAFDFSLPEDLIALRPARPRDSARLLVAPPSGPFQDRIVRDLPDLLRPGDVMVFNDTRVIPAALAGVRPARQAGAGASNAAGGVDVEVQANLIRRDAPDAWAAFARPGKRLKVGDRIDFGGLSAMVASKAEGGEILLRFDQAGEALDAAIAAAGAPPLPPYIADRRAPDESDVADYQTVFAEKNGSVAAPTAGLHFTDELLSRLDSRGIERLTVTLHVGAGTFLPVKTEHAADHVIHSEWREVSAATAAALNRAKAEGRRVIAVGTTALRTLESAVGEDGAMKAVSGETDIFITPGFEFRVCDGLWTNFHLPRSTLFMLVSAFSGLERMQAAYAHAVAQRYRFYSYGDASLLLR